MRVSGRRCRRDDARNRKNYAIASIQQWTIRVANATPKRAIAAQGRSHPNELRLFCHSHLKENPT